MIQFALAALEQQQQQDPKEINKHVEWRGDSNSNDDAVVDIVDSIGKQRGRMGEIAAVYVST